MEPTPAPWRIERTGIRHPDALLLVEQVQEEYVVRYGGRDSSPIDPDAFEPPGGAFFVGYLGSEPVATGAWRRVDVARLGRARSAEIKRMYVASSVRRRGLARLVLARLEQSAAEAGSDLMVLETGLEQPEALALYASTGYTAVDHFGHYSWSALARCLAKPL